MRETYLELWEQINNLDNEGVFVLLSHGNKNGPLGVAGDTGNDIDLDRFVRDIGGKNIYLYLLSCHTGQDPCGAKLMNGTPIIGNLAAPKGAAAMTASGDSVTVVSKDGTTFPGWTGRGQGPHGKSMVPSRPTKPIDLP